MIKIERQHQDQQVEQAMKGLASRVGQGTKKVARKAVVSTGKKIAQAIVAMIKAMILTIGAPALLLLAVGLLVAVIFFLLSHPITAYRELKEIQSPTQYVGPALSIFLDARYDWTEEQDAAAMEEYLKFKDKNLEGLNEFQKNQAASYALPYSVIMAIERMELFMWDQDLAKKEGLDYWKPRPTDVYKELETHYGWKDSEINYDVEYTYSYSYTYKWDEKIPPKRDMNGKIITPGRTVTHTEKGKETNVSITYEVPFNVQLLSQANAYDQFYILRYGDYKTDEDLLLGGLEYTYTGNGDYTKEGTFEAQADGHGEILMPGGLLSNVESHAEATRDQIRDSFKGGAYDIKFDYNFVVDSSDKTYQPVVTIQPMGHPFARIRNYLIDRYNMADIDDTDIQTILYIAAEYDEEFAYNFTINDGFLYFNHANQYFDNVLAGNNLGWPIPSGHQVFISSYFGVRGGGMHYGIDIACSDGKSTPPLIAAEDGIVTFAGLNGPISSGYGQFVIINHGQKNGQQVETLYGHLCKVLVKTGQEVKRGQVIGLMGTTGRSTGIHLHYEVRINGQKYDPLSFYPQNLSDLI